MQRTLLCALFITCGASSASASPWSPGTDSGYIKLWGRWLPGSAYYRGDGARVPLAGYRELTLATYGEFGLGAGLAIVWQSDLVRAYRYAPDRTHATIGDPALGVRWQFFESGGWAAATELLVRAPLANADGGHAVTYDLAGDQALGPLRPGVGVWSGTMKASGGYAGRRWFTTASIGSTLRTGGFDPSIEWAADVGYRFPFGLGAKLRLAGHHAVAVGSAARVEAPSGLGNATSFTGTAIEIDYALGQWTLGYTFELSIVRQGVRRQAAGPVSTVFISFTF